MSFTRDSLERRYEPTSVFALCAAGLISVAGGSHSQNEPAQQGALAAYSKLPPIFKPGNKVTISGQSVAGTITILEVHGNWVLLQISGQSVPSWIRPASMNALWTQAH